MTDDAQRVSRSVECPRCRAEAMLTYARAEGVLTERHEYEIVYLCPNMCALQPHQVSALIAADGARDATS